MSTLPAAISGVWAAFCQEKTFKPQEVCVNMPPNTKAGCTANVYNQIIPLNDSSAPDVMSWSLYCGLWMKRSLSVVMSYDGSDLCVFLPVEPECVLDDVFTFKTGGCRNALWSVNEHHYVKLKPMLSSFFFKHLFWASICSRGWDIKLLVNVVKVFQMKNVLWILFSSMLSSQTSQHSGVMGNVWITQVRINPTEPPAESNPALVLLSSQHSAWRRAGSWSQCSTYPFCTDTSGPQWCDILTVAAVQPRSSRFLHCFPPSSESAVIKS